MGGAPARVDGRLGLLEGPQFPPDFDHDRIPVFNTNTATIALDALDRDFDLPWLHVAKSVDGRTAVQLERLYHQIAWVLDTTFLEVPRSGRPRPVLPDQGARRPRAGTPGAAGDARCLRARLSDTKPARRWHGPVHACGRSVGGWASSGSSCPDAAPAATLPGPVLCERVPRRPRPDSAARLRALRLPGCVARPTLRRVLGPPPRVRPCPGRAGLRRACAADRVGLEGAWAARPRAGRSQTLVADVVARPAVDALVAVPGDRERGRERGHVPAARLAAALGVRWQLPVASLLARTAGDEPPAGRACRARSAGRTSGVPSRAVDEAPARVALDRRRLHDRGDRVRVRDGASSGGRTSRRGHLPRAGSAVG